MKKLVCIVLTMLLMLCALGAMAADGDFSYVVTNGSAEITSYSGSAAEISIPASIDGYPVTGISGIFYGNTGLKRVDIPEGVTSIGDTAFYGCTGLESVKLPSTLTGIGKWAFTGCQSLTSIDLPDSLKSIGEWAFNGCTGLTGIDIPESVTSIREAAFCGCTGLTSVEIPKDMTSIEGRMFESCTGLKRVEFPEGVTSIGMNAFYGCTALESVKLPGKLTSIETQVFYGCKSLTGIDIPKDVTSIGNWAFAGCTGLTSMNLPGKVKSIGDAAFFACSGLTNLTFEGTEPPTFGKMLMSGNNGHGSLQKITVPEGSEHAYLDALMDKNAEGKWAKLLGLLAEGEEDYIYTKTADGIVITGYTGTKTNLVIPKTLLGKPVTGIGDYAFSAHSTLQRVTIPEGVKRIGVAAFAFSPNIESVTIPGSVTSIDTGAFFDCTALTSLTFEGAEPPAIGELLMSSKKDHGSLQEITVPEGSEAAYLAALKAKNAYGDWESLLGFAPESREYYTYTETADGVVITGYNGTETNLVIPSELGGKPVTGIGDHAFEACTSLQSVVLPESVTSIGYAAFSRTGLQRVVIPKNVTSIGVGAFDYNNNLVSVKILGSVKHISDYAFSSNPNLASVELAQGVESIGYAAFAFCPSIERLTIPGSVTNIDTGAFYDCTALTSLTFEGKNPPAFGEMLMSENGDHGSLQRITVPAGSEAAYLEKLVAQNPGGDWERLISAQEQLAGAAADLPKTGDVSMLGAWICLLGASAAGMKLRRKA